MSDRTMDRRKFLECAAMSGAMAAALPLMSGAARPRATSASAPELEEATVAGLQAGMASGQSFPIARDEVRVTNSGQM